MSAWTLTHGDCLDPVTGLVSLADRSVDHVICDPPYSEHTHSKQWIGAALTDGGAKRVKTAHAGLGFDAITEVQAQAVITHAARVVRRWVLLFSDLEGAELWRAVGLATPLEYVRTCIWDKVDGAPQFTGDRPAAGAECFLLFHHPGKKRWNGGGRRNVWHVPVNGERGAKPHPSTKPLDLMTALVRDFTDHGETILDPFAGSGTTGVAAIQNGRRFIGWERDARYHAVASKRLGEAREQPGLALGPKVRPAKTADMFGGTKR